MTPRPPTEPEFEDNFEGDRLDPGRWVAHYLPAWSSRAATAASLRVADSCLHLEVPADHPVWCEGDHTPTLRVSGVQSASWSGPLGSTRGQQPYRDGLLVAEEQEPFWGWTPAGGMVEVRMRMVLSPRSMAGVWLSGLEVDPEESAEICLAEVFGNAVVAGESAMVGVGLRAFRDPSVVGDFEAVRVPVDVAEMHDYAIEWDADVVRFLVDGQVVRSCTGPPAYPMQLMVAVFDFPDQAEPDDDVVPSLVVDHVRGYAAVKT